MFVSKRQFKIWDYNVSHQQLLLRSPKAGEKVSNIDIVFWGVQHLSLPSVLDSVSIRLATTEEIATAQGSAVARLGDPFLIESGVERGIVFASGYKALKNELEIFDSSLVYFDRDRPEDEYGIVLVKS